MKKNVIVIFLLLNMSAMLGQKYPLEILGTREIGDDLNNIDVWGYGKTGIDQYTREGMMGPFFTNSNQPYCLDFHNSKIKIFDENMKLINYINYKNTDFEKRKSKITNPILLRNSKMFNIYDNTFYQNFSYININFSIPAFNSEVQQKPLVAF